jgi:hypothetical protein
MLVVMFTTFADTDAVRKLNPSSPTNAKIKKLLRVSYRAWLRKVRILTCR